MPIFVMIRQLELSISYFCWCFRGLKCTNSGFVLCKYAQYIPWEAIYRIIMISRVKLHVAKACAADHVRHWSNSVMCGSVKFGTWWGCILTAGHTSRTCSQAYDADQLILTARE